MKITMNDKEIRKFESDLKVLASRAYPFATKQTVNATAFLARRISQKQIGKNMIVRAKGRGGAKGSVMVNPAKTLRVSQQAAVVGSTEDYMEVQEFGGTKGKKGKHGTPIATSYASGEGLNTQPRKRLPRAANKIANIQLRKRRKKGATKSQRAFTAVREAAASNRKIIFMDTGKTKGLFKVIGGKRKPRVKMLHDLSHAAVTIPRNPWLKPSVDKAARTMPLAYRKALRFQLRRNGLFG